jgi:L-fuculose-phosphate aldolase
METIEHFAKISLVARMLGRENLITRQEVDRLQGLRGMYGIKSPAPICADPASVDAGAGSPGTEDVADCQIVQAPSALGTRLVPEFTFGDRSPDSLRRPVLDSIRPDGGGEIRLTYRELSALIEDAIRNLR